MNRQSSTPQISDCVDQGRMFLVNLSEIEGRIDPQYYYAKNKLELVNSTIYPVKKISQVLNMQRGRFGHRPRNDPSFYNGEYPFIQTGDIVRAGKKKSTIGFSQTLNEKGLKTSRLFDEKVVVFTIAANIGYTAILDYPACFPDSLIAIKPKSEEIILEYIDIYLSIIRTYIESLAPQAAQKNINYQQLSLIPFITPPVEIQSRIIEVNSRSIASYKIKIARAKNLLDSIDDYLLKELGIKVPDVDNSLSSRIFTVQASRLKDSFDPSVFFNEKYEVEGGLFENFNLYEIVNIQRGTSITSANIEEGDYPVIAGGKTSPYNHSTFNFTGDTITVSASGAYSGYVWFHDYSIFASDCLVLTVKPSNICSTKFIYEVLKTKQEDIYRLQKGAGQPHVYARDLKYLQIPVPPTDKQQEIVEHIDYIRATAAQLQQEADEILASAKHQIENMILGEDV